MNWPALPLLRSAVGDALSTRKAVDDGRPAALVVTRAILQFMRSELAEVRWSARNEDSAALLFTAHVAELAASALQPAEQGDYLACIHSPRTNELHCPSDRSRARATHLSASWRSIGASTANSLSCGTPAAMAR